MKTKNLKRIVLVVSIIGFIGAYILSEPVKFGFCNDTYSFGTQVGCLDKWPEDLMQLLGFLSIIFFLLSLLTYKMKDEVFTAWIKFATWWVPVIMLVTYLQSTQSGGGGLGIGGALSSGFDALVLGFFYFIFILVSLVIIVKKYRATR